MIHARFGLLMLAVFTDPSPLAERGVGQSTYRNEIETSRRAMGLS
jgi:hypothetical protein